MIPHIKNNDGSFTVYFEATPFVFDATHPEYIGLVECVKTGDTVEFESLLSVGNKIENWSEGNFDFVDGFLFYEDEPVREAVTTRIISMMKEGWDVTPMLKFLDRLYSNPSNRAVTEFYDWIQHKGLAITPEGYILGYKGVITYKGPETKDKAAEYRRLNFEDLIETSTRCSSFEEEIFQDYPMLSFVSGWMTDSKVETVSQYINSISGNQNGE